MGKAEKEKTLSPFFKKAPVRLWVKSKFLGFRRNREN